MPDFHYTARDASGEKVSGTLTAAGRREALAALKAKSLFPTEVQLASVAVEPKKIRRVPAQLLATTFAQMSDLLRSGVPMLRTLQVLQKQTSHAGLKQVLEDVHNQVEQGSTLAQAMVRYSRVFGEMSVSMVRAGGEGGFLEEALSRVAQFTEAQDDLKKRTIGALVYPMILAVAGTLIVSGLVIFFVPMFADLFSTLREKGELPLVTEGLLLLSDAFRGYGLLIFAAMAVGGYFAKARLATDAGKLWWDKVRIRVPMVGPIMLDLAVARFCRVLGTLLHNGVPILRSLEISAGAAGNRVLAASIVAAGENVSSGETLAEPLAQSGKFPPAVVEMIAVAEQANNLEKVLLDISDGLERRTWRKLDLAVRLIEPLLLVVMAVIVLVVVIALLLPILRMSKAI